MKTKTPEWLVSLFERKEQAVMPLEASYSLLCEAYLLEISGLTFISSL